MNRPDDSPKNSILIYTTEDGLTKIDTTFDGDTVWLSIDQMQTSTTTRSSANTRMQANRANPLKAVLLSAG